MNKKKIILWGITLLTGLMLTGCGEYSGGYGYREYPYDRNCPGDYGQHYCAR